MPIALNRRLRYASFALLAFACLDAAQGQMSSRTTATAATQIAIPQLAQQALSAFSPGGSLPQTITLSGTATWIAGSLRETGTVTLTAASDGSSSEVWSLPTQSHSLTKQPLIQGRTCVGVNSTGHSSTFSDANCLRSLPWFAPWIGPVLSSKNMIRASDSTGSADTALGMERLVFQTSYVLSTSLPAFVLSDFTQSQNRAAVTLRVEAVTHLPSSLEYNEILDSDPAHVITEQVVFSNFGLEAGYLLPHRLQRYVQRTLQADITITHAEIQ